MTTENKIFSPTKRKMLILLLAGMMLSLSHSPSRRSAVYKWVHKAWKEIPYDYLHRCVKEFYNDRLVSYKEKEDGEIEIVLTEKGKKKAVNAKFDELEIKKPKYWDKLWRVFIFDIPEKRKSVRNVLREKLRELGFIELQKSVFIFPYPCEDEINFIVEVCDIRQYVRLMTVKDITNSEELKLKFDLID